MAAQYDINNLFLFPIFLELMEHHKSNWTIEHTLVFYYPLKVLEIIFYELDAVISKTIFRNRLVDSGY